MKRFAMILLAAATLIGGIGVASAQMHVSRGGSVASGGSHGGGWRGGGNWNGGSRGGDWSGAWRGGGHWNGGWRGGHSRVVVGVGFGAPLWGWGWWPGYYPYYPTYYYPGYPYYYDPYDYDAYPSGTYIQQGQSTPSASSGDYSYYCPDPAGYYPQVRTCAKGWLRVVPQSAPGPTGPAY